MYKSHAAPGAPTQTSAHGEKTARLCPWAAGDTKNDAASGGPHSKTGSREKMPRGLQVIRKTMQLQGAPHHPEIGSMEKMPCGLQVLQKIMQLQGGPHPKIGSMEKTARLCPGRRRCPCASAAL